MSEQRTPIIGISAGDLNGIGLEVIIKTFADSRMMKFCTPVIYASTKVISYHRKATDLDSFNVSVIRSPEEASPKAVNVINVWDNDARVTFGNPTAHGGEAAFQALDAACRDLELGLIEALVTAPIDKHLIQSDKFNFAGHTGYLGERFKAEPLMLLVDEGFRIGVVTGHIPVREVAERITKETILKKLHILHDSLRRDFAIPKPKIAVLGLNPHAGDHGLIGKEENEIIKPALEQAGKQDILAFGPYPADGFFGMRRHTNFDAVLAMYHDQGLIPFKTLSFDKGVNFTAGLPIIRTSPDHGTAFDLAGKDKADPTSFREAVYMALDLIANREMHDEINEDPLVKRWNLEKATLEEVDPETLTEDRDN